MQRLSSESTWLSKKGYPLFLFGFLGVGIIATLAGAVIKREPGVLVILFVLMPILLLGYKMWRSLILPLVDELWLDGEEIVVRNGKQEDRLPLANVVNVSEAKFSSPPQVTLLLREPCPLGHEIVFMPPSVEVRVIGMLTNKRHPVVTDLLRRVHDLKDLE